MTYWIFIVQALIAFSVSKNAWACSALSPIGSSLMLANYDWRERGGMIISSPNGISKTAFLPSGAQHFKPATWEARYSSLIVTQWGREFPMQGMNSKGLAGAVLNGPAQYYKGGKTAITEMQWLQYQLDNYEDVRDVARNIKKLSLVQMSGQLHYFLCDARGACILIEFINHEPVVYALETLPVRAITNDSYENSLKEWNVFTQESRQLPQGYHSLERFVRAATFSRRDVRNVKQALLVLEDLEGLGLTQWGTVFDLARGAMFVKAVGSQGPIKILVPESVDHCSIDQARMRVLHNGRFMSWEPYDPMVARKLLERVSQTAPGFTDGLKQDMIECTAVFECCHD